jgi:DNA-directed RNA polymerase subunit alpha
MTELLTLEGLADFQPAQLAGREKLNALKRRISTDAPQRRIIAAFVADQADKAKKLRSAGKVHDSYFVLGMLQWALSRFEDAAQSLAEVKRDEFARELEAECCLKAGMCKQALKLYGKLAERGSFLEFDMGMVASLRGLGENAEADKLLAGFGERYAKEAEFRFQVGLMHDLRLDYDAAVVEYERALKIDPGHADSLFRLACVADLRGDDEEAARLYERCVQMTPVHVNALMNLGVLYEDMGRYEEAVTCFERVLKWNPNHERARLFLGDARDSITMYYDEDLERKADRENRVLEIPVSDFELSVRSRNCLERMNVKTLGDLTRVTELDLLSYKNFGETSLNEIKAMMSSRGLRLGQVMESETARPKASGASVRGRTIGQGVTAKPVTDLELSVRSRKCMQRLGIATIADLCERSEDALLACKNFGQTSLNEIKQKLANLGLKLKDSE